MKELFGSVIAIALFLALSAGVIIGGAELSFDLYNHYGPKYAAAQRQIYVQSPSFIIGNQAELEQQARLYRETSDPTAQATIRAGLQASVDNLPADFPVPYDVNEILKGE